MYYLDVKHAFRMFIKKMRNEFKTIFQDSTEGLEEQRYILHLDKVEEATKALGIEREESLPGNINFQVRIIKVEKLIELRCFAHHHWDNPPLNAGNDRQWGMLKIPIVSQKEEEILPEKFILRKMEFHLSVSYVSKLTDVQGVTGEVYCKHSNNTWQSIDVIERIVTENIKERHKVNLGPEDGGRPRGDRNDNRYENDERGRHREERRDNSYENDRRNRHRRDRRESSYDRHSNQDIIRLGREYTPTRRPLPMVPNYEVGDLMELNQRQGYREGYGNNRQPVTNHLTERERNILKKAEELGFECEVVPKSRNLPEPQTSVYHHLERGGGQHQDYYNSQDLSSMNNIRPTLVEKENDIFRPRSASKAEQRYANNAEERYTNNADQREPRRSTGGWETEIQRARFVDKLPPVVAQFAKDKHSYTEVKEEFHNTATRFPKQERAYEDVKYITRGEPQKPGERQKVTELETNIDRSPEQWQTIQNIRSTIGGSSHFYEEPRERKELLQWVYKPLERFRGATNEDRAKTPVEEEDERAWTTEMVRNIDALSLTGARSKIPPEGLLSQLKRKKVNQQNQEMEQKRADLLTQEQERKRVVIQLQMAHINTLNQSINSQVQSSRESPEDEDELYSFKNILCSTHPALVGQTYANRLEIMSGVQVDLEKVVRRKSNRLQRIQAEKHDLKSLSKKERGNLE